MIVNAMNKVAMTAAVHSRLQIGASFFSINSSMVATLLMDSSMPATYSAVTGLCTATHLRSSRFDLSFRLYRSLAIIIRFVLCLANTILQAFRNDLDLNQVAKA